MFLRNSWYVFGWKHELASPQAPVGRIIIGEPVVVWRDSEGTLHALEDRCPHRHAPLSVGQVEGGLLRCMYHGLAFDGSGRCVAAPLQSTPPNASVRVYPIVEKDSWLWVWMGDPARADEALIPDAHGIENPLRPMRSNSIEYDAHYQLLHDNLCDLSHVDFVHSTTLQVATGVEWAQSAPRVQQLGRSIRISRWFEGATLPSDPDFRVDTWNCYEFSVPGIFVMRGARYPEGTAAACQGQEPVGIEPLARNIEQQAVTPISETRTAYHYATGLIGRTTEITQMLATRMDVVMAAFEEDRDIIQAQQKIWNITPGETPKLFLPQDKAPFMMRQMMAKLISQEANDEQVATPAMA